MEATEESPLLATPVSADPEILKHDLLYERFTPSHKRVIVAVISWAALIPCALQSCILRPRTSSSDVPQVLASGSFIPSIPEIARELDSTGPIIKYVLPCFSSVLHRTNHPRVSV